MSAQSILGVIGTATIDVCDVERLMLQRDTARAERDRARELAAYLEQLYAEARRLLELAVAPSPSHAHEELVGGAIADFLREVHDLGEVSA